jgi:hypothetical protein
MTNDFGLDALIDRPLAHVFGVAGLHFSRAVPAASASSHPLSFE